MVRERGFIALHQTAQVSVDLLTNMWHYSVPSHSFKTLQHVFFHMSKLEQEKTALLYKVGYIYNIFGTDFYSSTP